MGQAKLLQSLGICPLIALKAGLFMLTVKYHLSGKTLTVDHKMGLLSEGM